MKLFLETKKMTFDEENNNIEHELILKAREEEFLGYDRIIDGNLPKNKEGEYIVREQKTWYSFPLYELKDGKIIDFDYTKYSYFQNTKRRNRLATKINELYNPSGEAKILRKTLRYIMDTLGIEYPDFFKKYNNKIEEIISKNPKKGK